MVTGMIKIEDSVILDVRTPAEFIAGHVAGSKNIPLKELPLRFEEIKAMKNIIVCCASGVRSEKATIMLKQNGIYCLDGGAWTDLNTLINNNN